MIDYSQGKVYVIKNLVNDKVYVGSTCRTLAQRFSAHKEGVNSKPTYPLYMAMFELGKANFFIELLEAVPCTSKQELTSREKYWVKQLNSHKDGYNKFVPARDRKEYYEDHKEKKQQYQKQYREANKETIQQKLKQYYKDNKEKASEYQRRYKAAIKEKIGATRACTQVYIDDNNYIGVWLQEMFEITNNPKDIIKKTSLYSMYKSTCNETPQDKKAFHGQMVRYGIPMRIRDGYECYCGLKEV